MLDRNAAVAERLYQNALLEMKGRESDANVRYKEAQAQGQEAQARKAETEREYIPKRFELDKQKTEADIENDRRNTNLRARAVAVQEAKERRETGKAARELAENGGLPKGYVSLPHFNNASGKNTNWVINEKTFNYYLPTMYSELVRAGQISPVKTETLSVDGKELLSTVKPNPTREEMRAAVGTGYASYLYNEWMRRMGAINSETGDQGPAFTSKSRLEAKKRQPAGRKSVSGFGGGNSEKKKIEGFGNH